MTSDCKRRLIQFASANEVTARLVRSDAKIAMGADHVGIAGRVQRIAAGQIFLQICHTIAVSVVLGSREVGALASGMSKIVLEGYSEALPRLQTLSSLLRFTPC